MSKEISITSESVVTKGNQLVEARYRLTLREQRFILLMASMIEPDDKRFTFYKVPTGELIKVLGWENDHRAHERLRKMVKGLMGKTAQIQEDDGLLVVTWVASSKYLREESAVEFEFSERLKPYLLRLREQFTSYKLANVVQLQSAYSIRLYELLKQYETIGSRRMTLEELREYLDLKSKAYDLYGNIKHRVLKPAHAEINNNTDISFTFDEVKHGRRVVGLRFKIKAKKSNQSLLPAPDAETEPTMVKEMRRSGVSKREANKIWGEQWEFLDKEAREAVAPLITAGLQFDQYVRDKLFLLESTKKQKEVPSSGGFVRDAIKHNWTNGEQEARREKAQQKAHIEKRRREEVKRRQQEDEEQRNQRMRELQLEARYVALSPTEQEKVNKQVYERLLERDELSAYRVQIERASSAVDSTAFFEALPSGTRIIAKSIMRELVANQ